MILKEVKVPNGELIIYACIILINHTYIYVRAYPSLYQRRFVLLLHKILKLPKTF